jgi:chloramphenicol-sensitive protein RarD
LDERANNIRAPLLAGLACYGIWGLSPLVFQAIGRTGADAWEIIGHRAVWGVLWAAALVLLARQGPAVRAALARPRTMGLLLGSTALILFNWVAVRLGGEQWPDAGDQPRLLPKPPA